MIRSCLVMIARIEYMCVAYVKAIVALFSSFLFTRPSQKPATGVMAFSDKRQLGSTSVQSYTKKKYVLHPVCARSLKTLGREHMPPPQSYYRAQPNITCMADSNVMILLDVSSSMAAKSKMRQAKAGCRGFAEEMMSVGYSVGMIPFASEANEILPPTRNRMVLNNAINRLTASGSTNMTEGIRLGMERLLRCSGRGILFLVTDGMPDDPEKALAMAEEAKNAGIEIYTHGTTDSDKEFLMKMSSSEAIVNTVQDHLLGEGIRDMARELKQLPPVRLN